MADISKRIRYIATDFQTILTELQNKAKSYDKWKDIDFVDSVGGTLLDLYAYVGDLLMYHLYMIQNENFLATAQLKQNVMKIAKMLNYKPSFAIPAHGRVKLYLDDPYGSDIIIPKYTKLSSVDGIPFITIENATIQKNTTEVEIEVVQGILKQMQTVSDGTEYQRYGVNLNNEEQYITNFIKYKDDIEIFKGIEVFIDSARWEETDYLILCDKDDQNYIIENYNDHGIYIQFGNNITGKIPPEANMITIQYLLTLGEKGKIIENQINSVDDHIYDANGIVVNDIVKITNEYGFSNGADPEIIERTKALAPKWFATGDRAITKPDIETIIMQYFDSIKDTKVWAEEDVNPPNFKLFNVVNISILLEDDNGNLIPATQEQLKEFDQILSQKRSITVWRKYIDPEPVYFDLKIEYKRKIGVLPTAAENAISSLLSQYFKDNGKLGSIIKHSDLVRIVDDLDDYVDYCYVHIKKNDGDYEMTNYKLDFLEYPILNNITYIRL